MPGAKKTAKKTAVKTAKKSDAKPMKAMKAAAKPMKAMKAIKAAAKPMKATKAATKPLVGRSAPASLGSAPMAWAQEQIGGDVAIHDGYDIDMNISDAAKNIDKFHRMQVLSAGAADKFYFATHYGRNGTTGQTLLKGPFDTADKATKPMEAKFKEKSGKAWADRDNVGAANSAARAGKGHYELSRRLDTAGAGRSTKQGQVAISLMWEQTRGSRKRNDLDLWVKPPSGEYIGWTHRKSHCGGHLDVDRMQSADDPVENIVWSEKAPRGEYKVYVNNYSGNHSDTMPFQVGIQIDGGDTEMIDAVSKKTE